MSGVLRCTPSCEEVGRWAEELSVCELWRGFSVVGEAPRPRGGTEGQPVRAGVSSMGFGGINAHIVIESSGGSRRGSLDARTRRIVRSRQDRELLLLYPASTVELRGRVARLAELCFHLAVAELNDPAADP